MGRGTLTASPIKSTGAAANIVYGAIAQAIVLIKLDFYQKVFYQTNQSPRVTHPYCVDLSHHQIMTYSVKFITYYPETTWRIPYTHKHRFSAAKICNILLSMAKLNSSWFSPRMVCIQKMHEQFSVTLLVMRRFSASPTGGWWGVEAFPGASRGVHNFVIQSVYLGWTDHQCPHQMETRTPVVSSPLTITC